MARFRRLNVLQAMIASGLVPVFYHKDLETAKKVARACRRRGGQGVGVHQPGGLRLSDFYRSDPVVRSGDADLILGVGSVIDPGTASLYINNGANFIVGPVLNAEVARTCNRRRVPYLPGCGSASEISRRRSTGWRSVRYFRERGGRGGVREEYPCADALDAHHADRRCRDDAGVDRGLVQGGRCLCGDRFEPDRKGTDRHRRFCGDRPGRRPTSSAGSTRCAGRSASRRGRACRASRGRRAPVRRRSPGGTPIPSGSNPRRGRHPFPSPPPGAGTDRQ